MKKVISHQTMFILLILISFCFRLDVSAHATEELVGVGECSAHKVK